MRPTLAPGPSADLPALVEALRQRAAADPSLLALVDEADEVIATAARAKATADNAAALMKAAADEAACSIIRTLLQRAGEDAPTDTMILLGDAQKICSCSAETMIKHVRQHGLGKKIAGRWKVSRLRLMAWTRGEPFTPIR